MDWSFHRTWLKGDTEIGKNYKITGSLELKKLWMKKENWKERESNWPQGGGHKVTNSFAPLQSIWTTIPPFPPSCMGKALINMRRLSFHNFFSRIWLVIQKYASQSADFAQAEFCHTVHFPSVLWQAWYLTFLQCIFMCIGIYMQYESSEDPWNPRYHDNFQD